MINYFSKLYTFRNNVTNVLSSIYKRKGDEKRRGAIYRSYLVQTHKGLFRFPEVFTLITPTYLSLDRI